ncbi:MAG: D-aminoacylase [Candidatus Bathyarchaeia archaeon]|nr:D-aminoacylase [Candidatus Bathyarchaeota archaeon]
MYDLLIKGGRIIDGSGNPWIRADIGIIDGRISDILRVQSSAAAAREEIDARGMVVCPGFIDIHSHSDFVLLVNPMAESKVRQGVTTEVIGNCGDSAAPAEGEAAESARKTLAELGIELDWSSFSEYLQHLERMGVSVNVATLVGHGTVRKSVMGYENRPPEEGEMEEMRYLVAEAMEAGAFGLSSGLVYPPGRFAETWELIELCRVVAEYGGFYATHVRGERETLIEAVLEAVEIGERAGIPVQISHHPAKIGAWGRSRETLRIIDEARARGLDITFDLHAYLAGSTGVSALLPPWAQEGGAERMMERLGNPNIRRRIMMDMLEERVPGPGPCGLVKRGMWDRIILSSCRRNRDLIGRSIDEIARLKGIDPFEAYFRLLIEEETSGSIIGYYYNEEDIRTVLRHPSSMIGSDGYALAPYGALGRGMMHPRSYGAFPMIIRKYVRGMGNEDLRDTGGRIITLEEAVRKMASLPAQRVGLLDRGLLKVGMWADIIILDPERVRDRATYLDPYQYPEGIEYVIVNGGVVVRRGMHTGALPGKILRHSIKRV